MILSILALFTFLGQARAQNPECPVQFSQSRPFVPVIAHQLQSSGSNVAQEFFLPVVGKCSYNQAPEASPSGQIVLGVYEHSADDK